MIWSAFLIHTQLQLGVMKQRLVRNRFNGFGMRLKNR